MVVQSPRAEYAVAARPRTDLQTASWRLLREEWAADRAAVAECEEWARNRSRVRDPMLALLARFLSGRVGLELFRSTFDRRTRTDWDAFALKGASGAMFLNALVKHARHPVTLGRQLRRAMRAPAVGSDAAVQLADFVASVAPPSLALDASHDDTRVQSTAPIAPTHAVFFATIWWHLQAPDRWPAFQPSSRQVLFEEEELFTPSGEPVRDYFVFREASCRSPRRSSSTHGSSSISAGGTHAARRRHVVMDGMMNSATRTRLDGDASSRRAARLARRTHA